MEKIAEIRSLPWKTLQSEKLVLEREYMICQLPPPAPSRVIRTYMVTSLFADSCIE